MKYIVLDRYSSPVFDIRGKDFTGHFLKEEIVKQAQEAIEELKHIV